MRILFVSKALPGPEVDGYVVRNRGLLSRFGTIAEVDVLSFDVGAMPDFLAPLVRHVEVYPDPGFGRDGFLKRAFQAFSPEGLFHRSEAFAAALRRLCLERNYDAVWLGGWQMLMYVPDIQAVTGAKIIGDPADDEVRSLMIDREKSDSGPERMALWRSIIRHRRFEERYLRPVDIALYVSSADAETTAARHPNLKVEVCQNGVDTDDFSPAETPGADPVLVLEGTMSFPPNVEGAVNLVHNILPLIQSSVPNVKVLLVGRNPSPEVLALASDAVEVTGTVDNVREAVLRGNVFVSPLVGGTGQKNKILQAWSMAMPIVATPVSVTGLEAHDKDNILIAKEPQAFADACIALLQSETKRRAIGDAGRQTALDVYSVERRLDGAQEVLERVVGSHGSREARDAAPGGPDDDQPAPGAPGQSPGNQGAQCDKTQAQRARA